MVVGLAQGRSFVAYRVSSRSFPNRRAQVHEKGIAVSPLDLADLAKNPYISYKCIRVVDDLAVVSNGTHTDMIAERIEDGERPGDAIALSLLAFGHERDEWALPASQEQCAEIRHGWGLLGKMNSGCSSSI